MVAPYRHAETRESREPHCRHCGDCLPVAGDRIAQRRITSPDGHAATEIRGHYEGAEEPVYVGGKWIEIS
jgi:hypothetical protein